MSSGCMSSHNRCLVDNLSAGVFVGVSNSVTGDAKLPGLVIVSLETPPSLRVSNSVTRD